MKRLLVILTVAVMLTGCFGGEKEKVDSTAQENVAVETQETESSKSNESISNKEQDAETEEENKIESKEEGQAILLENEGDIEIIVPDDQAFGGE